MMDEESVRLPPVYELVVLDKADSALAQAARLAAEGADEGTLVWAKSQQEGLGRSGNYWMSGYRNLHCALILRPEESVVRCCQLSLVATICAAMSISDQAEPMAELRYRWPNDVLLNRGKVAGVTLRGMLGADGAVDWLVVGLNVNAFDHPGSKGFAAASMRGEGFEEHDRSRLLEVYSREFVSWANRWADEGFEPVRRAWLIRGNLTELEQCYRVGDETVRGKLIDLDGEGNLTLTVADGPQQTIGLADYYASDFRSPAA